jgi:hypothetical protein
MDKNVYQMKKDKESAAARALENKQKAHDEDEKVIEQDKDDGFTTVEDTKTRANQQQKKFQPYQKYQQNNWRDRRNQNVGGVPRHQQKNQKAISKKKKAQ